MSQTRMFGEVAFEKGFISTAQLYEGLRLQAQQELGEGPRDFLGEILIELGYLTEKQVLEILTELHGQTSRGNAQFQG